MIFWVAASERERAQTDLRIGVVGSSINQTEDHRGITWEGERERVRAPYSKWETGERWHLSRAGHEKSCLNQPGPSGKAKYERVTDSEPVPWGKGEKNPGRGVKENLKPYVYKQTKHVKVRCRTFCRTVRRVILYGKVKYYQSTKPKRERVWKGRISHMK